MRINRLEVTVGEDLTPSLDVGDIEVRWDVWPQWVRVAEREAVAAERARAENPGPDDGPGFGASLTDELVHGMTSISAAAFAMEAFTGSVNHFRTQPQEQRPASGRRQGAASRIHSTWVRAFRMSNQVSRDSRKTLGEIFAYRNQAVHSPAEFVPPAMHTAYPVAIEPRYVMFRHENATTAARFTRDILGYLIGTPRAGSEGWAEWCAAQSDRLTEIS
jgi:hypothetical protein